MSASRPSVFFVGTHDPAFARTAVLAEGLRRCGYEVGSCVEPTWGPTAQRVAAARRGFANPLLAWRLLRAYARLARRLRPSRRASWFGFSLEPRPPQWQRLPAALTPSSSPILASSTRLCCAPSFPEPTSCSTLSSLSTRPWPTAPSAIPTGPPVF